MKKILLSSLLTASAAFSSHAAFLLQDSLNYPYTNGCIEGQGQWYCYSPSTPALDAYVTNNVLYLNATNKDSVATPTNSFYSSTVAATDSVTYASFTINVSQLPTTANGGYFFQFQDTNNTCCHIFVDTVGTQVPGTYRLGIGNFTTSFAALQPPINYPEDLVTGVTYTVVCDFDTGGNGATLWIDPSLDDYTNSVDNLIYGDGIGLNFVYATDKNGTVPNIGQVAFSPYVSAGISNVMVGTEFSDVVTTNLPVFALPPQSQTNYSGNSTFFVSLAAGVDLQYQWFSTSHGALTDDGVNIIGSTSNILYLNNLSTSDDYYVQVTDIYNNQLTSGIISNTVITTPTPVFFPASQTPLILTNNLFTYSGFTNIALGTGPIYYQWYFAPTNTPNTYSPLSGQNTNGINLFLSDYTSEGNYYLVASNAINGGSLAFGPTNSLIEIAPLSASVTQLHNLELSEFAQIHANPSGTIIINSNNAVVSGYVTLYGGFGSTSYSEYYIQDTNNSGVQVYLYGYGNTNTPPVGTYVTVTGEVEVYHTGLELAPSTQSSIQINTNPPIPIKPVLANAEFNDLTTNALGTNAFLTSCSLITFSNVYIYRTRAGAALNPNQCFYTNGTTTLYFTLGAPYSSNNTNTMEIYQYGYNYTTSPTTTSPFYAQPIPTYCAQLTGIYLAYGGIAELSPSRLADYVTNVPSVFSTIALTNKTVAVNWPNQVGSTYSVYDATNVAGPWVTKASGLNYFPTNTTYVETNSAGTEFYKVTSP